MELFLITKPELKSTNETMSDLLMQCPSLMEGTVVRAVCQTAGKGQVGNHWESEDGKNLTFSLLLRPLFLDIQRHFFLSIATSLGIADYLESLEIENVKIKWPNDIYVKGNKICGILIENVISGREIDTCTVGIGLNVNQVKFVSDAPNPVSVAMLTGRNFDLDEAMTRLFSFINERYEMLRCSRFDELKKAYLSKLYRYNELSQYRIAESGEVKELVIDDVKMDGTLCVKDASSNKYEFVFKEIEFLQDEKFKIF